MSSKKNYEFRSKKTEYGRNKDGLRPRRLKEDARWKFNPNQGVELGEGDPEQAWFYDPEQLDRR